MSESGVFFQWEETLYFVPNGSRCLPRAEQSATLWLLTG